MTKIYGYVRVSTMTQSIERQRKNILKEYPKAIIFSDEYTGTTLDRKGWQKLYKTVSEGDTIIFDEVSRLSRNAKEGFEVYQDLYEKGVNLVFIKEPHINTEVYKKAQESKLNAATNDEIENLTIDFANNLLMLVAKKQIKLAFEQAQKERDLLSQRTKEGLARAKANGSKLGRPKNFTIKKEVESKPQILKHSIDFNGTLSDKELMSMLKLSRNTYYKYKRELKQEQ